MARFLILIGLFCSHSAIASDLRVNYLSSNLYENVEDSNGVYVYDPKIVASVELNLSEFVFIHWNKNIGNDDALWSKLVPNYKSEDINVSKPNYNKYSLGVKILKYTDSYFKDLYVEYSNEYYLQSLNKIAALYREERVFLGLKTNNEEEGSSASFGFFQAKAKKELHYGAEYSDSYALYNKGTYSLSFKLDDVLIAYKDEGRAVDFSKYGVGLLIDDVEVRYPLGAGDNEEFTSIAFGLRYRTPSIILDLKAAVEIFGGRMFEKKTFSIGYEF